MKDGAADQYMPLTVLADYSGLSVRKLREYLLHPSRPLPHYRPGGKVLVRRSEFDAWMSGFKIANVSHVDAIVDEVLSGL